MPIRTNVVVDDIPVLGSQYADVAFASLMRKRAEQGGHLTNAQVRSIAKLIDKGESTLWTWVGAGAIPKKVRPHYVATSRDVQALFDLDGSFAAAWRLRRKEDPKVPSYDTYLRAVKRELQPADVAEAKGGPRGADKYMLTIPVEYENKNSVLHIDAMQFDVPTKARGWHKVRYPWVVSAFVGKVRAVAGFAVTFLEPTQEDVMEAIYQAIVATSDSPFHGIPDAIRCDNGSQFTADAVDLAQVLLQIDAIVNEPYQPHLNGLLERFHRTLKQEFEVGKPHNRQGPKKRDGKTSEWPKGFYLDHDDFVDSFVDYIYEYNTERKHSSLKRDGRSSERMTPLEAWNEDESFVRDIDPALARRFLTRSAEVTIASDGIKFEGSTYWDPILVPGRKVQIHYGNDRRSVEVYDQDEWVVTAYLDKMATTEMLADLLESRTNDRRVRGTRRSERRRSKQVRVTSRTGAGETSLVSGLSAEQVKEEINERLRPEAASPTEVADGLRLDDDGNRIPRNV